MTRAGQHTAGTKAQVNANQRKKVVVFGVIFARVIVMSGQNEDRTGSIPEKDARTTIGGVKGLRGSLP